MKKSLIALAVLAAAGTASAQSSVTLFGIVDTAVEFGRGELSNNTRLVSAGLSASRLGFRGTEDLGGGMSASFWLEAQIASDSGAGLATNTNNQASGATTGGGLTFGRRSTVSLAGGWGELRLGRDYVPTFWNLVAFDPLTLGSVAASAVWLQNGAAPQSFSGVTGARASNSIGYFLPKLGGFYGQFMHFRGENASGAAKKDGTGNGLRVGFASGPFNIALALTKTEYNTVGASGASGAAAAQSGDVKSVNLGGEWNFGVAKVMGHFAKNENGNLDGKGWLIGAVFPVGAGDIRASYSTYEIELPGADPQTKKLAVGYVHNLSKRTNVYTTVARLKNSGGNAAALGGATTTANSSSTGLDLGIRHSF